MKVFKFLIVFIFLLNCNSEQGSDCFTKQGKAKTEMIFIETFEEIHIGEGIALILEESENQSIELTYGENFIQNIQFEVIDGILKIENKSSCGVLRNYHAAEVFIRLPNLKKIYSASQYSVKSKGILRFPDLLLESGIVKETAASVFELTVDNASLTVNDNISSVFKISGKTDFLKVNFWGANGRLEAGHLEAETVAIFHRSSNDMVVFPLKKIEGKLMSTGNLVLKNVPEIIDIEQIYTGKIIYP